MEAGLHLGIDHHAALAVHHPDHAGVQRHLRAIEIVPLQSLGEHRWIGVARDADEAGDFLVAQLVQRFEDAALGLDLRQVVVIGQGVDVDKIELVDLKALQTAFENLHRFIAGPLIDLRGHEDSLTASLHDFADALFAQAVAIAVSRIHVGDAQVQGAIDGFERFVLVLVHEEAAAAAKRENGHMHAGLAELARGQLVVFIQLGCAGYGGCDTAQSSAFQETSS